MKRPWSQPEPVWDWRTAIVQLSGPDLNELIRTAQSILAEKQDELREEMLARFRREAGAAGLSFDDLFPKAASRQGKEKEKEKPSAGYDKLIELPANAETRIIRVLKFNNGQAGQKLIMSQCFPAAAKSTIKLDEKTIAWVKRQRRIALVALLNDMIERNVIVVLRPPRGIGTQTIYGLAAMQAAADEGDEADRIKEAAE